MLSTNIGKGTKWKSKIDYKWHHKKPESQAAQVALLIDLENTSKWASAVLQAGLSLYHSSKAHYPKSILPLDFSDI